MHRMKIGLIAAAVLVAFTAGAYVFITGPLEATATRQIEEDVARAERLHSELARLEALDFTNLALTLSRRAGVAAVFDRGDETGKRQTAFEECEAINAKLASQRKADIVAIVDAQGKVVARDLNVNAMYGENVATAFPPVANALKGVPSHGVVELGRRMSQLAVAPVAKSDGRVVGALLLGYAVTARDAQAKRDRLAADVGYFFHSQVQTTSFTGGAGVEKEDGNRMHGLNAALFPTSGDGPGVQALATGRATSSFRISLDGQDYLAIAAPLYPGEKTAGFVVLSSISRAADAASAVGRKIIGFGILAILVALGVAVMTALRFIKPLDEIELGVAEIINGNIDYTFRPVGPDFEGLSNGLNVMLARLLGREEPNEDAVEDEEGETPRWQSDQMVVEEIPATALTGQPTSDPAVMALAAESEAAYFPRLYSEYLAALKAAGKPMKGFNAQLFGAKLRLIEGGLKQKWKCKQVRFRVSRQASEVTLIPVPIY